MRTSSTMVLDRPPNGQDTNFLRMSVLYHDFRNAGKYSPAPLVTVDQLLRLPTRKPDVKIVFGNQEAIRPMNGFSHSS